MAEGRAIWIDAANLAEAERIRPGKAGKLINEILRSHFARKEICEPKVEEPKAASEPSEPDHEFDADTLGAVNPFGEGDDVLTDDLPPAELAKLSWAPLTGFQGKVILYSATDAIGKQHHLSPKDYRELMAAPDVHPPQQGDTQP